MRINLQMYTWKAECNNEQPIIDGKYTKYNCLLAIVTAYWLRVCIRGKIDCKTL